MNRFVRQQEIEAEEREFSTVRTDFYNKEVLARKQWHAKAP